MSIKKIEPGLLVEFGDGSQLTSYRKGFTFGHNASVISGKLEKLRKDKLISKRLYDKIITAWPDEIQKDAVVNIFLIEK